MYRPSLTTVVSVLFLAYMANSMWNIIQLYLPPPACPQGDKSCISNLVTPSTRLSLLVFSTTKTRPQAGSDLKFLARLDVAVEEEKEMAAKVKLPKSVTNNGTMYLSGKKSY